MITPLQRRLDGREPARWRSASTDLAGKRLVSYLPMAHIAERMTSHYQQAVLGYEVTHLPRPGPARAPTLREVRPNIMFGVPRVWEKIHAGVVGGARPPTPSRRPQFDEARRGGQARSPRRASLGRGHRRAGRHLGLPRRRRLPAASASCSASTRSTFAITGAAPIPRRAARVVPGHRRAAVGDLRHVRVARAR